MYNTYKYRNFFLNKTVKFDGVEDVFGRYNIATEIMKLNIV